MAKAEIEKPNKRNVEYLLKRELEIGEYYRHPDYVALHEQINELEEQHQKLLERDKEYITLCKKKEQVGDRLMQEQKVWKNRIAAVRREYHAKGLTPAVLKKVEKLVDDYNTRGET